MITWSRKVTFEARIYLAGIFQTLDFLYNGINFRKQVRNVTNRDIPDRIVINCVINMGKEVASPLNNLPRNLGMPCLDLIRDIFGRLTNDLKVSNQGFMNHKICLHGLL